MINRRQMTEFKVKSYQIEIKGIDNICKSPSLWMTFETKTGSSFSPVVYFKKPKWISEESFINIVKSIEINLPKNTIIRRKNAES